MYQTKITNYFENHKDEMLKSLKEIMSIDSSRSEAKDGMPFGEGSAKALLWAENFAKTNGFRATNFDNHVIDIDFTDGEPALAVLSHLDVVPAGEGWTYPPFDCTVDNGVIYGRGAIDDKGPSVAVLYSMKCIKELGIKLNKNFRVVLGGDEEEGCKDIEYYQTKRSFPPMVFTPDGSFPVLNCEKGMVHLKFSGEFSDSEIESISGNSVINAIAAKCVIRYKNGEKKVYTGKNAHGSRPENGDNAITKFLADFRGDNPLLCELAKMYPYNEPDGKACKMNFSDEISGPLTMALTILSTENSRLCGGIDIRFPINKKLDEIKGLIISRLEKAGFVIDEWDGMEAHYVAEDTFLVQKLLETFEQVSGKKGECIAEGGITYVHNTENAVAFGAEFPEDNNNMHGADEHISLDLFMLNCNMYCNAIVNLCRE